MKARAWRHFDFVLILTCMALMAYGLLLIYSGSLANYGPHFLSAGHPVLRQAVYAAIGLGVLVLVAQLDYRVLGTFAPSLYVLALVSLVAVLLVGSAEYGSRRWFVLGPVQIQPSELAKLITIVVLAKYLSDRQPVVGRVSTFVGSFAIAALPALLVFVEPDLGSSLVFFAIWFVMVLMAGANLAHILTFLATAVLSLPFVMVIAISDYQRERIATFLDPESQALGSGFNILQAEISIGSGGLWGKGFTEGAQTQLDFLRTQTTDYIFSVLGEELGFVGAMVLFALFILLLFRALRAARIARDLFGSLIAVGMAAWILTHVFINVGVNVRLFPVTGIPLPFISQGGSSLVAICIGLGLVESILLRHRRIDF
ncbi:MAG TPA: rod shape-determining protein RodA [Dehalococcoidia bacterium]